MEFPVINVYFEDTFLGLVVLMLITIDHSLL
jgi:hypothetical protein